MDSFSMTQLNPLTPHVTWLAADHRTDRPVLGAVSGEYGTLVVDGGNSPAHVALFRQAVQDQALPPLKYLAITHWHWDHVFGIEAFHLPTFASTETQRIVQEMVGFDWSDEALDQRVREGKEIEFCRDNIRLELPDRSQLRLKAPDIAFEGQMTIDLGGVTCQLVHVGGDHAADSSVVFVAEDRVMFVGDCVYEDLYSNPHRYHLSTFRTLVEKLLSFEADYYLESHTEPKRRAEFKKDLELILAIGEAVQKYGPQRSQILARLPDCLGQAVDEDVEIWVDAFMAGLKS
jgi:glyoxylase-like metal-dependent hydrolase (beta-lactamase superfamily II)